MSVVEGNVRKLLYTAQKQQHSSVYTLAQLHHSPTSLAMWYWANGEELCRCSVNKQMRKTDAHTPAAITLVAKENAGQLASNVSWGVQVLS